METTAATFLTVPLNKLAVSPRNVRKTDADCIDDLLSSIPVHGLLQSLVVEPGQKKGQYLVVAGGRRLRALNLLAKEKALAKDYLVPCRLAEGDYENLSLAENVIRAPMLGYVPQLSCWLRMIAMFLVDACRAFRGRQADVRVKRSRSEARTTLDAAATPQAY